MNKSKTALVLSEIKAYTQIIIGSSLLFLFLICVLACLVQINEPDISTFFWVSFFMFGIPGGLLAFFAKRNFDFIHQFKRYVAAISKIPTGSISDIAAALKTSVDEVKTNLNLMIQKKFFADAYIDHDTNCIIFAKKQEQSKSTNTNINTSNMVTVTCKGCGAVNTIQKGTVGECDYCGTPIEENS